MKGLEMHISVLQPLYAGTITAATHW